MLQILVMLLQFYKTVTMEKLATVFGQPTLFESRRRSISAISTPTTNEY